MVTSSYKRFYYQDKAVVCAFGAGICMAFGYMISGMFLGLLAIIFAIDAAAIAIVKAIKEQPKTTDAIAKLVNERSQ